METEKDSGYILNSKTVKLSHNKNGATLLKDGNQSLEIGNVVGAYPISNKGQFISIRNQTGDEIGILNDMKHLDGESRRILREELERAYFMPSIKDITGINENLRVLTWKVRTDKGFRTFQVKHPQQNVRSVGKNRFIVKDVDGNRYEIQDLRDLPIKAQSLVETHF